MMDHERNDELNSADNTDIPEERIVAREFNDFLSDIRTESAISGDSPSDIFFNHFSEVVSERGDCPELDPCQVLGTDDAGKPFRMDGFQFESVEAEQGKYVINVYVAACFFDQANSTPDTVRANDMDDMVAQVKRAVVEVCKPDYYNDPNADNSSAHFGATLFENLAESKVSGFKIIILTNKIYETRRKVSKEERLLKLPAKSTVLDWADYSEYVATGSDPIRIDFTDYPHTLRGVPCIKTSENEQLTSYLLAVEGAVIADLMDSYDNRLLESNVRTYLEARTKTNKGILKTIKDEPHLFFAYNNGITATARQAELHEEGGALNLISVTDLQIVNGGQTSSSLLYAREQNNLSLEGIKVQMKLNVLKDDALMQDIVPNISRYSNTQNAVSEADLISNAKFQSEIDRIVSNLNTPKLDRIVVPKWFYERARGQYKSLSRYKSDSARKSIKERFPPEMVITKTDAAKYFMSTSGRPDHVAKGAQKCFLEFSKIIGKMYEAKPASINEYWVKQLVAKAILFKNLDSEIGRTDWYKDDRGYKSQAVIYTIAMMTTFFDNNYRYIDFDRIWNEQKVPSGLLSFMVQVAEAVREKLKSPPSWIVTRNVAEFAKSTRCIDHVNSILEEYEDGELDFLLTYGVEQQSVQDELKKAETDTKEVNDMALWSQALERRSQLQDLTAFLKRVDTYDRRTAGAITRIWKSSPDYKEGDGQLLDKAFTLFDDS